MSSSRRAGRERASSQVWPRHNRGMTTPGAAVTTTGWCCPAVLLVWEVPAAPLCPTFLGLGCPDRYTHAVCLRLGIQEVLEPLSCSPSQAT